MAELVWTRRGYEWINDGNGLQAVVSIHWEESEDARGPVWLRFVECGHWGLFMTDVQIRWIWIYGA